MFNLGTPEIIVILAIALLLFGPKKLPEIGRSLGQGLRELRRASREAMSIIEQDEPESKKEVESDVLSDSNRNS
jgi:TatA/E family protein of Tat protein translocase